LIAERRAYRNSLQHKRESFWQFKIDDERSSPRQLWQSLDAMISRGHALLSDMIDAHQLHQFFDDKVAGVRASTADAMPPTYTAASPGCPLSTFCAFTSLRHSSSPDKHCATDLTPTRLLKDTVHHRDVQPVSVGCRLCHTTAKKIRLRPS